MSTRYCMCFNSKMITVIIFNILQGQVVHVKTDANSHVFEKIDVLTNQWLKKIIKNTVNC
jgi:hypothetical protein